MHILYAAHRSMMSSFKLQGQDQIKRRKIEITVISWDIVWKLRHPQPSINTKTIGTQLRGIIMRTIHQHIFLERERRIENRDRRCTGTSGEGLKSRVTTYYLRQGFRLKTKENWWGRPVMARVTTKPVQPTWNSWNRTFPVDLPNTRELECSSVTTTAQ